MRTYNDIPRPDYTPERIEELKTILFNRYYRGGYVEVGGASFRKWYLETYLQIDLKLT